VQDHRIESLDLLRGIAALSVAISHYHIAINQSQFAEVISVVFVEIFFPLSGFVLAKQILLCQSDSRHLPVFYFRRLMRTIPPYLFAMSVTAFLTNNLFTLDFIKYLFFIQDIVPNYLNVNFYPVAWSLAIEEFYYLFFPLLIIVAPPKRLLFLSVAFICFFQILKILAIGVFDPQFIRIATLLRVDSIALGFFGYYFLKDKVNNILTFMLLVVFGVLMATIAILELNNPGNNSYRLLSICVSSFFGLFCVLTCWNARENFSGKTVSLLAKWMGRASYPIYLFHIPILTLLNSSKSNTLSTFPLYMTLLITVSLFINIYFEKPILSARPKYKSY
jgi:peptidoglycan/LPS O-acetylase OafA/YrhL